MRKYLFTTALVLCTWLGASAQDKISGVVTNHKGDAIPYAVVEIKGRYVGDLCDSLGAFSLELPPRVESQDSVLVSCVGYESTILPLEELLGSMANISLEAQVFNIEGVVVDAKSRKEYTIGNTSDSRTITAYPSSDGAYLTGVEFGSVVNVRHDCSVKSFGTHILYNDYKRLKLRLRIMSVKDGIPDKVINTEDIITELGDKQRGWLEIDLSPYNLALKGGEKVAIVLMVLEEERENPPPYTEGMPYDSGLGFSASLVSSKSNIVRRDKTSAEWYKVSVGLSMHLKTLR